MVGYFLMIRILNKDWWKCLVLWIITHYRVLIPRMVRNTSTSIPNTKKCMKKSMQKTGGVRKLSRGSIRANTSFWFLGDFRKSAWNSCRKNIDPWQRLITLKVARNCNGDSKRSRDQKSQLQSQPFIPALNDRKGTKKVRSSAFLNTIYPELLN